MINILKFSDLLNRLIVMQNSNKQSPNRGIYDEFSKANLTF